MSVVFRVGCFGFGFAWFGVLGSGSGTLRLGFCDSVVPVGYGNPPNGECSRVS